MPQLPVVAAINEYHNQFNVIVLEPEAVECLIDELLIARGEHPSRVRNPLYGEERRLAKDLLDKYLEAVKVMEDKLNKE